MSAVELVTYFLPKRVYKFVTIIAVSVAGRTSSPFAITTDHTQAANTKVIVASQITSVYMTYIIRIKIAILVQDIRIL